MSFRPVVCVWREKDLRFEVLPRFGNVARAQFRDGEEYPLEVREHRSSKSHAFYFASINSAHENLRGETAEILRTPEHLRKWALIEAGWFDQTIIPAASREAAMKMATWARLKDDYAEIKIIKHDGDWFLQIKEAKSQSRASMSKEEFEASKSDVLTILSGTIQVTRKALEREGKARAG